MYIVAYEDNSSYCLAHHGIKGQKWGIRRYQNEDGSYTEEGKKRYGLMKNGKMSIVGTGKWFSDKKDALRSDYYSKNPNGTRAGEGAYIREHWKDDGTTKNDYKKDKADYAKRLTGLGAASVAAVLTGYLALKRVQDIKEKQLEKDLTFWGLDEEDLVEPDYVEPDYVEPDYIEPDYVEPDYIEPDYIDPTGFEMRRKRR